MPGLENVLGNIKAFEDKVRAQLLALGQQTAAQMEAYAKENAPWENQSGNARKGLFGEAAEQTASSRCASPTPWNMACISN